MCRLYGFRATEPTKVECSLVHAQNALMEQSRGDTPSTAHGHGWGVVTYPDGVPQVEKQVWAAYHGEHFRKTASRIYSKLVIAHVRRATVGPPALENTHPFIHGRWMLAHNGTVPLFDQVRTRFLENMDPLHRSEIKGDTDSEHIFRFLLSLWQREPQVDLLQTLKFGLCQIIHWCREIDASVPVALNVLWSEGDRLVGSCFGRTLWYLERAGLFECEICGRPHVHHEPETAYRSVEVASEPITHEDWSPVPDGTVFDIDADVALRFEPLEPVSVDAGNP